MSTFPPTTNPFAIAAIPHRSHRLPEAALVEKIEQELRAHNCVRGTRLNFLSMAPRYGVSSNDLNRVLATLIRTGLLGWDGDDFVLAQELRTFSGLSNIAVEFPSVVQQFEYRLIIAPACAEAAAGNTRAERARNPIKWGATPTGRISKYSQP